ncbi:MAG: hypothetical protein FWC03_01810 [Treponema sp.]|nr:hypothetical protein [Treponema sp.]
MNNIIGRDELLTLIPHRNRMCLLSRVNRYNLQECSIEAEYDITDDCMFYDFENSGVPAWVGFEFIAQSISAFIGIKDKINCVPIKEGFILGVSHMQIDLPFFGKNSIITINSRELENLDPIYIFDGRISVDGKKVLAGKVTVMEVSSEQKKGIAN